MQRALRAGLIAALAAIAGVTVLAAQDGFDRSRWPSDAAAAAAQPSPSAPPDANFSNERWPGDTIAKPTLDEPFDAGRWPTRSMSAPSADSAPPGQASGAAAAAPDPVPAAQPVAATQVAPPADTTQGIAADSPQPPAAPPDGAPVDAPQTVTSRFDDVFGAAPRPQASPPVPAPALSLQASPPANPPATAAAPDRAAAPSKKKKGGSKQANAADVARPQAGGRQASAKQAASTQPEPAPAAPAPDSASAAAAQGEPAAPPQPETPVRTAVLNFRPADAGYDRRKPQTSIHIKYPTATPTGLIVGPKTVVRPYGLAVNDVNAICTAASGARWGCGRMAYVALWNLVISKVVDCEPSGSSDLREADCFVGNTYVSTELLREGWGRLAPGVTDRELVAAEQQAKQAKVGLWSEMEPQQRDATPPKHR